MTAIILLSWALSLVQDSATPTPAASGAARSADPWAPVRVLEGEWVGVADGEPGIGTVHRSYQFVLGHRFLHERNISAYAPKKTGTGGELHEHWSFISFDKKRKVLVLRQFHQEGFVNQFVLDTAKSTPRRLIFESETFENLDPRWRARETYDLVSDDEFTETFELAEPGKDLQLYSKNTFKRTGRPS